MRRPIVTCSHTERHEILQGPRRHLGRNLTSNLTSLSFAKQLGQRRRGGPWYMPKSYQKALARLSIVEILQ